MEVLGLFQLFVTLINLSILSIIVSRARRRRRCRASRPERSEKSTFVYCVLLRPVQKQKTTKHGAEPPSSIYQAKFLFGMERVKT